MRHRVSVKRFSRKSAPNKALFRNLATSLVLHEKIVTTKAKAKELRRVVEPLITKGKANSLVARRALLAYLYHESAVKKVLEVLSPRYKARPGGYTRIYSLGARKGDGAQIARIEFV